MPFQKINNTQFVNLISSTRRQETPYIEFNKHCSVCTRRVNNTEKAIPCYICKHYIHRKCSNLSEPDIQLTLNSKHWHCMHCQNSTFPFHTVSNNELLSENFNSNNSCPCNDSMKDLTDFDCVNVISELNLNKLDLNHFHPNSDNDIDHNLNLNCNFDYYTTHEFHKLLSKLHTKTNASFSLMHTNICSVNKNLQNLELLATSLGHNFDIIAVSEAWITKYTDTQHLALPGYQNYYGTPGLSRKGGCGFFVGDNICFTPRPDLDISFSDNSSEFEASWIEITNQGNKNFLIAVIYRHPRMKNDNDFLNYISNTISNKVRNEKKTVFITGDFNINLLNIDSDDYTSEFLNLLLSNFYQPHILQPTRITNINKPTLIDNIFLNSIEFDTVRGNLTTPISDHLPNFIFCYNLHAIVKKPFRGFYRDYKSFNPDRYVFDLRNAALEDNLLSTQGANEQYNTLHETLINNIQKHAPLKPISRKAYKQRQKPWITRGILKSISIKNKYYKKFMTTKKSDYYKKYKYYRDQINHLIRKSKKDYYITYFDNFKENTKKLWSGVKEIINKKSKDKSNVLYLQINGKLISDNKTIANSFNKYFTTIAQKLQEKMKSSSVHFSNFMHNNNPESIFLDPVTPEEVNDIIANLDESKANDSYEIPIKLIKLVRHTLSKPFSIIANSSFTEGVFPDKLKFAKVTPIYKSKSKQEVGNYRPISILPIFRKILEKLMNHRLVQFLNKHNIIFEHQHGFQKNKSTTLAILELQSQLIYNIENNLTSCCIFLDLSKAFDTVNHSILLSKLEHYGIRGVGHSWFKSYLDNRTQIVTVNGENSTEMKINCGVPQGSILGPLLFLLYINDIYNSSEVLDFLLIADDTSILFADKSLDAIEQTVNYEMKNVSEWLLANKLSLNVVKSNFLIIRPHKNNRILNLKINDENLKQETSSKYLGVLIDDKLNWKHHINQLNTKLSKSIGILYRLRHLIPKSTLVTLYNSFIQSHVLYGLLNWGCANKTTLEPLKITLRKAVRVIDFASYTAHTEPIFKGFKLLNLENLYKLETAKFMFQINQENPCQLN